MKIFCVLFITLFSIATGHAQNVGIGTTTPSSKLSVSGNVAAGSSYAGTTAAPTNGAIIQGRVGIGNNAPNSSAILDLSNSNSQGFAIPAMTTAQMNAIPAPALGLTIFNTTVGCLEVNMTAGSSNWKPACN